MESVTFNGTEGVADTFGDVGSGIEGDDAAAARDEIHEALERGLHGVQIAVDVGVVELDVGEDERVGKVVHELGTLIEEGGVVLVAFEDEGAAIAELEAGAEVFGDASDEEGRGKLGSLAGRRLRRSTPACWWWWFCRGCRRRRGIRGLMCRAAE